MELLRLLLTAFLGGLIGYLSARALGEFLWDRARFTPDVKTLKGRLTDQCGWKFRLVDPAFGLCLQHPSSPWLDIDTSEHHGGSVCLGCLRDLSISADRAMKGE